MNDEDTKQATQYVAMITIVCLILGGAFLVGAIFGAGFGFAAFFILTACWLLACLWAYGKSKKDGDGDGLG